MFRFYSILLCMFIATRFSIVVVDFSAFLMRFFSLSLSMLYTILWNGHGNTSITILLFPIKCSTCGHNWILSLSQIQLRAQFNSLSIPTTLTACYTCYIWQRWSILMMHMTIETFSTHRPGRRIDKTRQRINSSKKKKKKRHQNNLFDFDW